MCNGANMAFRKSVYDEIKRNSPLHSLTSGDDISLMFNFHRQGRKLKFLKSKGATVTTPPPRTLMEFLNQRLRWGSKGGRINNSYFNFFALLIFSVNFLLLILFLLSILDQGYIFYFIIFIILKCAIDFVFLNPVYKYFRKKTVGLKFIPAEIFHLLYIPVVAILSRFTSFEW